MAYYIICALIGVVILKPTEFIPALMNAPVLYVLFFLGIVLIVLDLLWKKIDLVLAPQVPYVVAFLGWALLTTALKRPDALETQTMPVVIVLIVYLLGSIGLGSSDGLRAFAITYVGCAIAVAIVATIQGLSPSGCMIAAPDDWGGKGELVYDGRACETTLECLKDAPDPLANYRCEHVGPWKTASVGGRVRYRGSLADPNELTLMTGIAIPLAFALVAPRERKRRVTKPERRRRLPHLLSDALLDRIVWMLRAIPLSAIVTLMGVVTVLSKSRGGLLVYLVVLGLLFIRRMGAWGIVAGCIVGPPMLLLGGRSGAEESTDERTDLLREAFQFIRETKGTGLGINQFSDASSYGLTAHNAYMLAAAEAGVVGFFLFGILLYICVKVPIALWFGDYEVDDWIRRISPALTIGLVGGYVGITFLSWSYKDILYILFAASTALYAAARRQDGRFRVRISVAELLAICTALTGFIFVIYVAARLKR